MYRLHPADGAMTGKMGRDQSDPYMRLLLGMLFSTGIGLLAYRRRSLTRSGVGGAILSGTTIFGMGELAWGLSLIYFFVSSSLLSHFRESEKEHTAADKFSKGSQRDLGQAIANGGVATLLALAYGGAINRATTSSRLAGMLQAGFVGALATANADTWATEVGVLSRQQPRLVTSGKHVAPGTSGGITILGTSAAALGALSLGVVFWMLEGRGRIYGTSQVKREAGERGAINRAPTVALISGLAGCLFDSVIGATIQAIYYCPHCGKETERRVHICGTRTQLLRGLPWMNNDVVNFAATAVGALVGMGMKALI